uniref:Omega-scoloptoxin-Ssm1a-like n=1 Tax=Ciona intestinalis TaxID=7719 RepID=H2XTF9_CIOIN|nr:omega-scoloptoxin-Ssm1a-like [Ciona intestinalis]|eukprot:XP_009860393.1 omega-scoloptoxin-Ssm1a-like [Ciona intestinalis]
MKQVTKYLVFFCLAVVIGKASALKCYACSTLFTGCGTGAISASKSMACPTSSSCLTTTTHTSSSSFTVRACGTLVAPPTACLGDISAGVVCTSSCTTDNCNSGTNSNTLGSGNTGGNTGNIGGNTGNMNGGVMKIGGGNIFIVISMLAPFVLQYLI